ncbi:MAG: helix-turn-helix domain-containing protein [Bacteroidaceae bacterium]
MLNDNLKKLSLSMLHQLVIELDEERIKSFVGNNLAVARIWSNDLARHFLSQPFMMNELRILVLQKGYVDVKVNMAAHRLEAGTLKFVGRCVVTEIIQVADDIQGYVLSISDELLRMSVGSRLPRAFDGHVQDFMLPLSKEEMDFIDNLHLILYEALKQEMSSTAVVVQLVGALMMHVSYLWEKSDSSQSGARSREQQLFSEFIQLVNLHAASQHSLDFYASRLCVTPRYMSTVVRNVSGKSAKYFVDEAITNAIKVQLRYTDKQIAEIANDMCFPNASFFGKFFRRMTSMTPKEYRDRE